MTKSGKPRPRPLPASPFVSPARPLGALVAGTLGDVLARRGFADADILAKWRSIAGEDLARCSRPEKLVWPRREKLMDAEADDEPAPGATLYLRVDGPAAIEIQHMAPQILERVNSYFGFAAVNRLRIVQAPLGGADGEGAPAQAGEPAAGAMPAAANSDIQGIDDPELARALARLGRAIKHR